MKKSPFIFFIAISFLVRVAALGADNEVPLIVSPESVAPKSAAVGAKDEVVLVSYNLANYLVADRVVDGKHVKSAPKPEKEIASVIRILKELNPDILGVCEMGSKEDFEDFKKRLEAAEMGFKHFEYVDGSDPTRHVALLSRFPFVSTQSVKEPTYQLNGSPEKVKRGFLDVTVDINETYKLRLIGVHLKSKLATPEGEALVRRNEAHLLREHVKKILADNPETNLMVYGDFNDTKNEPPIQEIMGKRNAPDHLMDVWLKDNVGDRWTHYWKLADLYSRIDFFFASQGLIPELIFHKCKVYRADNWEEASDHRPIMVTIHAAETKPREKK